VVVADLTVSRAMLGTMASLLDRILLPQVVVRRMPSGGISAQKSLILGLGQALLALTASMLAALWSQAFDDPSYPRMDRRLALASGVLLGSIVAAVIVIRTLRSFARAMPEGLALASGGRRFKFAWADVVSVKLERERGVLVVVGRGGLVTEVKVGWLCHPAANGPAAALEEACASFIAGVRRAV
jgi:hypothetical protein